MAGAGALGFGGGFAQGFMQALMEKRARRQEDERYAQQRADREFQMLFPVMFKEAQESGDFSGLEQWMEQYEPGFGKKAAKEGGSPFSKLSALLSGQSASTPAGSSGSATAPDVRRGPMVPTTAEEQQLPGAPTKIELPQRSTFMGVEMASPEERNRRLVQKTLDELTAGVTARRTLGQQQGLAGSDLSSFALTGDIPSARQATPAQPGSSAEYVGLKVQEALARGEPPTPEDRLRWRAEFDKQTEQGGSQGTEFGQYYSDWLRDKGKTPETSTAADRLQARREFMGAGRREGMTPGQMAVQTRQLRNDFVRETRASKEAMRQIDVMRKALAKSEAGDRVAGDQAVISTFNRMIEPNSVTMVSEYARTANDVGFIDRMREAVNRVKGGGSGVPIEDLQAMVALAEQFAEEQAAMGNDVATEIRSVAEEFGIKPELVTREFVVPSKDGTTKTPTGSTSKPASTAKPAGASPTGLTIGPDGKPYINGKPLVK